MGVLLINCTLSLDANELRALRSFEWDSKMKKIVNSMPFYPPFEKFFISVDRELNFSHPVTIALLRCLTALKWQQQKKTLLPAEIGKVEDQIYQIVISLSDQKLQSKLDKLWILMKQFKIIDFKDLTPPLQDSDYIPVSESTKKVKRMEISNKHNEAEYEKIIEKYLRPFGQPLEEVQVEEVPDELVELISKLRL
ncbi:MAG: hypothetical protein KAT90_12105 [Gammaproteobacteria bacterium]|nr:hypothetical protein [Gammaproteobacteria bacterium]